jgi:hypothetical protein
VERDEHEGRHHPGRGPHEVDQKKKKSHQPSHLQKAVGDGSEGIQEQEGQEIDQDGLRPVALKEPGKGVEGIGFSFGADPRKGPGQTGHLLRAVEVRVHEIPILEHLVVVEGPSGGVKNGFGFFVVGIDAVILEFQPEVIEAVEPAPAFRVPVPGILENKREDQGEEQGGQEFSGGEGEPRGGGDAPGPGINHHGQGGRQGDEETVRPDEEARPQERQGKPKGRPVPVQAVPPGAQDEEEGALDGQDGGDGELDLEEKIKINAEVKADEEGDLPPGAGSEPKGVKQRPKGKKLDRKKDDPVPRHMGPKGEEGFEEKSPQGVGIAHEFGGFQVGPDPLGEENLEGIVVDVVIGSKEGKLEEGEGRHENEGEKDGNSRPGRQGMAGPLDGTGPPWFFLCQVWDLWSYGIRTFAASWKKTGFPPERNKFRLKVWGYKD